MVVLILALAAAPLVQFRVPLTVRSIVSLPAAQIRVADVAVLDGLSPAMARRLGGLVLAEAPNRAREFVLSRSALARLIARRVPMLSVAFGSASGPIRFHSHAGQSAMPSKTCLELTVARAEGEAIDQNQTRAIDCISRHPGKVGIDAASRLRARSGLQAGAYLGRIAFPQAAPIRKGDTLRLIARSGPVRVERTVTAMQPGRETRNVFVQDNDGQVFSARIATSEGSQ